MKGSASGSAVRRMLTKVPASIAMLVVLSGTAGAVDVDYEVGVAARHSDNINLGESDPITDTVVSPRLYFELARAGSELQLAAEGDLQYLHYTSDTFDDDLRGSFAGTANWIVLPERLEFVLQDYLSLQTIDDGAAFSPDNQQQVNIFVAGPTLHARFNALTRGQLDLRYINSYAEEREAFDSDRFNVAARLIRELDANHSISANLEATQVDFDFIGGATDYRRYDGYLNSSVARQYIDLSLDLGYTRLEFDNGLGATDDDSYPLARARLDWRISPRSVLTTTVNYQLNDATRSLMAPLEFGGRDFAEFRVANGLVQPSAFRERLARVRYAYSGERLNVQVTPYHRRIRYIENLADDQDRRGAAVNLDLRLRPRMTLSAFLARENRDFVDAGRTDKNLLASVGLANRFTRHWTGRIDLQRRERDSTAADQSYDENAVVVSFSYQR